MQIEDAAIMGENLWRRTKAATQHPERLQNILQQDLAAAEKPVAF